MILLGTLVRLSILQYADDAVFVMFSISQAACLCICAQLRRQGYPLTHAMVRSRWMCTPCALCAKARRRPPPITRALGAAQSRGRSDRALWRVRLLRVASSLGRLERHAARLSRCVLHSAARMPAHPLPMAAERFCAGMVHSHCSRAVCRRLARLPQEAALCGG